MTKATPEGKVKKQVRKLLDDYNRESGGLWYNMPVPYGYGKPSLDFAIVFKGRAIFVETKAPGEWLTPLQRQTAVSLLNAGAKVFVVSRADGLFALHCYLFELVHK